MLMNSFIEPRNEKSICVNGDRNGNRNGNVNNRNGGESRMALHVFSLV